MDDDELNSQRYSIYRRRSLDDISHASSFYSSNRIKEPLGIEKSSKFHSHNDGLMSTSKEREFAFSPESAPYSRIASSPGTCGILII